MDCWSPAEFNAKCLHLDEKFLKIGFANANVSWLWHIARGRVGTHRLYLDVDDLVPDEGLQKYADQPYQPKKIGKASQTDEDAPVLHVLVLDGLTGGNTVWYVEVDELCGQLNHRGKSVHNLETSIKKSSWGLCLPVVTSMLWRDISMLTSTEKYSVMLEEPSWRERIWKSEFWSLSNLFLTCMRMRSISMAIMGLFSTKSGNLAGVRPSVETTWGSFSSSVNNRCCSFRVRVFWLKMSKSLNRNKV